jgi:UDP-glucose 4-epimerase
VRYGNVLASRGSVIPVFHDQIRGGGPVTITTTAMTRFLISKNQAVDTLCAALCHARSGEILVPRIPSARMVDLAQVLIGNRGNEIIVTGIRPGEKVHEILVSEEECHRTIHRSAERGRYYAILPNLPELRGPDEIEPALDGEYNSADDLMTPEQLWRMLADNHLLLDDTPTLMYQPGKREAVAA